MKFFDVYLLEMTNRNKVKSWSITFPQSGDVERKYFLESFPPCEEGICVREIHEDGGYHLHLGIKLKKGIKKTTMLNWIKARWPNDYKRIDVQATRSIKCWYEYLEKEDPDGYKVLDKTCKLERIYKMYIRFMRDCSPNEEVEDYDTWVSSCNLGVS